MVLNELVARSFGLITEDITFDDVVDVLLSGIEDSASLREYLSDEENNFVNSPAFSSSDDFSSGTFNLVVSDMLSHILLSYTVADRYAVNWNRMHQDSRSQIAMGRGAEFDLGMQGSLAEIAACKHFYFYSANDILGRIQVSDWTNGIEQVSLSNFKLHLSQIINSESDLLVNSTWIVFSRTTLTEEGRVEQAQAGGFDGDGLGTVTFPFVFANQDLEPFSKAVVADAIDTDDEALVEAVYNFIIRTYGSSSATA